AYDFTVFAGTQGHLNHRKKDRMFQLARELRLPLILFAEGGGGRPGDTDGDFSSRTFHDFPRLSGLVPMVGIVSGRCFAGNASLLGCCDVVIATANSNVGMGGPAMIESGGLGVFRPEQIGPMSVQVPSGVVDIAVADEAEATRAARKYLSYFQGTVDRFECADQRILRKIIPENRLRALSCCATPLISRSFTCATRRASWSVRRSKKPPWCVIPRVCSLRARMCRFHSSRSSCARPTGCAR